MARQILMCPELVTAPQPEAAKRHNRGIFNLARALYRVRAVQRRRALYRGACADTVGFFPR